MSLDGLQAGLKIKTAAKRPAPHHEQHLNDEKKAQPQTLVQKSFLWTSQSQA